MEPHDDTFRHLARRDFIRVGAGAAALAAGGSGLVAGTFAAATQSAPARKADPTWPAPPIVTRAQWGADEALRADVPDYDALVQKIVVHHTVTPTNARDQRAIVRNVYTYHLSRGFLDVGYNLLIDSDGRIYEGRWAADYAPGAAHTTEDAQLRQVRGAHTLDHNAGTIGVALLGTFTTARPSKAMLDALTDVLVWKSARWGIDPTGRNAYVNALHQRIVVPNIIGHRDVRPTMCPGDGVHPLLPDLRAAVAQRLDDGHDGWWVVSRTGAIVHGGMATPVAVRQASRTGAISMTKPTNGRGLWVLTPDGRVLCGGGAPHHGDLAGRRLSGAPRAIVSSVTGGGYYLLTSDGRVHAYGDARRHGSLAGHPATPIVALAPTPKGLGYWLLGRDGGVFSFGTAGFHGSAYPHGTTDPATAIIATRDGKGYWIFHRSGRIRAFGSAPDRSWSRAATAAVLHAGRSGRGFVGLCADGTFVHTPGAPALASARKGLAGTAPAGFVTTS
jgi:hypothetical protein